MPVGIPLSWECSVGQRGALNFQSTHLKQISANQCSTLGRMASAEPRRNVKIYINPVFMLYLIISEKKKKKNVSLRKKQKF